MNDVENIIKNRTLLSSEDYAFLREEGQVYLEQLAHKLWTDFNVHDPGITILEALCFAITDLGYRTNFDIKDLLESQPDTTAPSQVLFTARKILTCNPVTATDYRKLLVDIKGIHNAWLYISERQEIDFHAECKSSALQYYDLLEEIRIKDLDLNTTEKSLLEKWNNNPANTNTKTIILTEDITYTANNGESGTAERILHAEVIFPGWSEISNKITAYLPFINYNFSGDSGFVEIINASFGAFGWRADLKVTFPSEPAFAPLIIQNVKVKNVDRQVEVGALQTALLDGSLVVEYRNHLHKTIMMLLKHDIILRGLYDVLLEFDVDDEYGDLNSPNVEYTITYKTAGILKEIDLEILFPAWTTLFEELETYYPFLQANGLSKVEASNGYYDAELRFWEADLELFYKVEDPDDGSETEESLTFQRVVFSGIRSTEELDQLKQQLKLSSEASIAGFFQKKLQKILSIFENVNKRLQGHRNLCEDWLNVSGIGVTDVALCADIELASDASLEEVQAQIWFQVEQYFSPDIKFYSLKELTDNGVPSDEIFEGPVLDHGFINTDEIKNAAIRHTIFTSDIINILMDIDGILAVRGVLMSMYDHNGDAILPSAQWCLELKPRHKPRLNKNKSKVLYFKDELPFKLSKEAEKKMEIKYNQLKAISEKGKLITSPLDFDLPKGTYFELENYSPLRNLFPQTYGVGPAGLSEEETIARKSKAKQLKTFLLFFDQLLANYFSQLANIRELFSVKKYSSPADEKTYFTQYLEENLIGGKLYVDANKLKGDLHDLAEDEDLYLDRRNRFLDHLLSRFAEDFTEYTLLMHSLEGQRAPRELIDDKIAFLEKYDIISSERGKAFNYTLEGELWDTLNVSGLEKRVSKLLGMETYSRRFLYCETICDHFNIFTITFGGGLSDKYGFELEDLGLKVLRSVQQYDTRFDAEEAIEKILDAAQNADNFEFGAEPGGVFVYLLIKGVKLARTSSAFTDSDAAKAFIHHFSYRFRLDFEVALRKHFAFRELPSGKFIFELIRDGNAELRSVSSFDEVLEAYTQLENLLRLAQTAANYKTEVKPDDSANLFIIDDTKNLGRFQPAYASEPLAKRAVPDWITDFTAMEEECLNTEGMHLVEHILLRPKNEFQDHFFDVCLDNSCKLCGQEDPYSFRASVILPFWSKRFTDDGLKFRQFVDRRLRLEAPAPVHLKICWVGNKKLRRFEIRLKAWLEENAKMFPDPDLLTYRLNALIEIMGELRSVYPVATLHDCEDSEIENSVILNKTVLGTFNPPDDDSTPENQE